MGTSRTGEFDGQLTDAEEIANSLDYLGEQVADLTEVLCKIGAGLGVLVPACDLFPGASEELRPANPPVLTKMAGALAELVAARESDRLRG